MGDADDVQSWPANLKLKKKMLSHPKNDFYFIFESVHCMFKALFRGTIHQSISMSYATHLKQSKWNTQF